MLAERERKRKQGIVGERKIWTQRERMVQRKWSNPGRTWGSSWCNSLWHEKTYRLEVGPWSAVEPVPYFCAVSLRRGVLNRNTKTSQHGSPKHFAYVNKFSILSPGDNEFTGEGCTPMHTSRSQCQQRKCGEERGDECRRGDQRVDE